MLVNFPSENVSPFRINRKLDYPATLITKLSSLGLASDVLSVLTAFLRGCPDVITQMNISHAYKLQEGNNYELFVQGQNKGVNPLKRVSLVRGTLGRGWMVLLPGETVAESGACGLAMWLPGHLVPAE